MCLIMHIIMSLGSGGLAASGAADYYHYLHVRKKDQLRLKLLERDARQDDERKEYERHVEERKQQEQERLEKNRLKRLRKKKRKLEGSSGKGKERADDDNEDGSSGEESSAGDDDVSDTEVKLDKGKSKAATVNTDLLFSGEGPNETGAGEEENLPVVKTKIVRNVKVIEDADF